MNYCLSNDTWGDEEVQAAHNVIDSHRFTLGENVHQFEQEFAKKFGTKYAVMVNSGSSANLVAIAALIYAGKLKLGDEILVTAVSWSTTYYPITQLGLRIRFVDIDINSLNISIDVLEDAITSHTRGIFAVNLLGNPNDFDKMYEICKKHNLILIEDNCESMGAEFGGKKTGTFGEIGTFSMYYSHHICTMEGGVCVTDDLTLYHYMLSIRSHGWTRYLPMDSPIHQKKDDIFYESFNFIVPGFNVRPLEVEAAVGREQLKKLDRFVKQRRDNASYFIEKLSKSDFLTITETGRSSWFGFPLILPAKKAGMRKAYTDALHEANIEIRPIVAGNFVKNKALRYMKHSIYGELNNAEYIHNNAFFTGNHSVPMKEQIDYLFDVLNDVKV